MALVCFLASACVSGIYHVVGEDENLYRISTAYGVSQDEIARVNRLKDPSHIYAGQYLFIPGAAARKRVAVPVPPGPQDAARAESAEDESTGQTRVASAGVRETNLSEHTPPLDEPRRATRRPGTSVATIEEIAPEPLPKGRPGAFRPQWPVRGSILSEFGEQEGRFHEGLDIAGLSGTPIRAAADGRVIFAGTLKGYGKLVVLKHDDVYATLYAHNRKNLVSEGQMVKRGEAIAEMGDSGRASAVHLHFEVLENRKNVDPRRFLPKP